MHTHILPLNETVPFDLVYERKLSGVRRIAHVGSEHTFHYENGVSMVSYAHGEKALRYHERVFNPNKVEWWNSSRLRAPPKEGSWYGSGINTYARLRKRLLLL